MSPEAKSLARRISLFALLLAALCNMGGLAVAGITCYQRFLSPALNIHCAYAHALAKESCSAFAKRTLAERGFFPGLPLCLNRFRACARIGKGNP